MLENNSSDPIVSSLLEIAQEVNDVPDISEVRHHFEQFAEMLQRYLFPEAEVVFRPYTDNSVNRDATSWYISVRFTSLKPDFIFEENICSVFIPMTQYPVMINASGTRQRIMKSDELVSTTVEIIKSSRDILKRYARNVQMLAQFKPEG